MQETVARLTGSEVQLWRAAVIVFSDRAQHVAPAWSHKRRDLERTRFQFTAGAFTPI